MKPVFHARLVNDPFEDPCLYIRILREKRSLLFDMGDVSRLSPADLYKITDVFVTHTHIDHFIGFDRVLRALLRRPFPLNVYGPPDITSCVEGKLNGYAWNLIKDYPAEVNTYAFDGKTLSHDIFSARHRFKRLFAGRSASDGLIMTTPLFRVKAVLMDHGIPCLAFALDEEYHININKDFLMRMSLPVGPWLSEFKRLLRKSGLTGWEKFDVNGRSYTPYELTGLASITKGQKICYATDLSMTRENFDRLVELARDADIFYCEAYFLEEDRTRADERHHLTAMGCGNIARNAGAKRLVVMHFSPKYTECPERVVFEAMEAFKGGKGDIKSGS